MKKRYIIWFTNRRGAIGHDNLFPDFHIIEAVSLAEAELAARDGFVVKESQHSAPKFIFPSALLSVAEYKP